MNKVVIGIGSNQGEREVLLSLAVKKIEAFLTEVSVSKIYESKAVGMEVGHDQDFLNMVCMGNTELSAPEVLDSLINIECELGRKRVQSENYLSRTIDLDLLFFNNEIIDLETLSIPHPRIQERLFVLLPLMDLIPEYKIPGLDKTIGSCMKAFDSTDEIRLYKNGI